MAKRSEFVEHVIETMRAFGPVEAKSMFGGWGLYHEGVFFALIARDVLYLKADAENSPAFESQRLPSFVYESKVGERLVMSFRQAPAEALEDPGAMEVWARLGYAAALRAAAAKAAGKRKPTQV